MMNTNFLQKKANILRKEIFQKFVKINQGHPGSIFSIIDFLTVLYYGKFIKTTSLNKDKIIVSKGHATSALYPILRDFKILKKKEWDNWGSKKKSILRVFGNIDIPGIDMTSGSLGHGLGVAAGIGIANKKINIFTILSEGEFYEGSIWEGLLFIKDKSIKNVKIIIDVNNLIILGKTNDCLKINPLKPKIQSLGFECAEVNGHNFKELKKKTHELTSGKIQCLIINTIKGKGFKIMENNPQWHYWSKLSHKDESKCLEEINKKINK